MFLQVRSRNGIIGIRDVGSEAQREVRGQGPFQVSMLISADWKRSVTSDVTDTIETGVSGYKYIVSINQSIRMFKSRSSSATSKPN